MKQAIVWTSFGVADAGVRAKGIDIAAAEIAAAYPLYDVFSAYTSAFMRKRMKQEGLTALSLEECLEHLLSQGYQKVLIQPSHLTPGEEYDNKIVRVARKYQQVFPCLLVGEPVFFHRLEEAAPDDFMLGMETIYRLMNLQLEEALVLLGHGSPHRHNPVYEELQHCADQKGWNVHIGVVEESDTPNFAMVHERLKRWQAEKVLLAPLLLSGGVHVNEDMAGKQPVSWKSRLEAAGMTVRVSLRGLGEYPAFRSIYLRKLAVLAGKAGGIDYTENGRSIE